MFEIVQSVDASVLLWIQDNLRGILDPLIEGYTALGNHGAIWFAAGFLLCIFRKTRIIGILLIASVSLAYLMNDLVLKNIFARPRPFDEVEGLIPLVYAGGYSFPSGHTSAAFAFAGVLCRTVKKEYAIIGVAAAAFMGFSRIYLGVHYPTDVLAGVLVGILCSQIVWYAYTRYTKSVKI